MPRLGWLAVGLFGGAFAVESLGAGAKAPAALLVAVGWLGGGLLGLVARPMARDLGRVGLVFLGVGLALGRMALGAEAPTPPLPTGEGPWVGVVEAVGSSRDGRQRVVVLLEPDGPAVLLDLPPEPRLGPADVIRFDSRLELPPPTAYGDYLRRSGLAGWARVRTPDRLGRRESPAALLATARTAAADALARTIPEPEAGLAAGILVGLRERVDRGVAADFATVGLSHIVAISGWNIAIVGAAVATLARRTGRSRRTWLTIAAVVAYVAFVGASASVARAATMALIVLLVGLSGRSTRASAALAAAVCGLLLIDPSWAIEPGFQLSVAATAGLIRWGTPFAEGLAVLTGRRLPAWLTEVVGVSLAAQLATLPIVVAAFGRVSLVAPLANLVVVPLVPIAMGLAGIALVGGLLSGVVAPFVGVVGPLAATVAAMPAWLVLRVIVTTADLAAGLPFASLAVPEPTGGVVVGAATLAIIGLARGQRGSEAASRQAAGGGSGRARPGRTPDAGRGRWRKPAAILVVPVLAVLLAAAYRPGGDPIVVVFDVGQGDAILVEGGRGGRLLVDGGPDPGRLLRLLDARLPPWDRRLDVVVVSHPHEDHVAGLPTLLTRYRVGAILTNGMAGTGPAATTLAELLVSDRRAVVAAAGDRLAVDDVTLDVLWPVAGTVPATAPDSGGEVNDASLVLLGAAVGNRFLLSGDIEEGIDPELVARGLSRLDLLKVPHHGSRTATTAGLLEATRPSLAVISVGADNPYGHPAQETLLRLREAGAAVLRTDEDGSVEIVFRPGAMEAHSAAGVRTFRTGVRTFEAGSRSEAVAPTTDGRSAAPPIDARLVAAPSPGVVRGPSPSASVELAHAPLRLAAAPPLPRAEAGIAAGIGYDRLDGFPRAGRADDRRPPPAGGAPSGDSSPSPRVGSGGRSLRGRARSGPDRLGPTARTRHGLGHSTRPTHDPTASPPRGPPRRMARRGDAVTGSDGARSEGRVAGPRNEAGETARGQSMVPIGFYSGDDEYALEEAAAALARRVAGSGPPLERWRVSGAEQALDEVAARLGSAALFDGGTIAIVREPAQLVADRSPARRASRIDRLLDSVASGNALAILDLRTPGSRPSAVLEALRTAVSARGGETKDFRARTEGAMTTWLLERARERGIRLEPAAATELASRVGAFVTEGDVDRRGMARLASLELDKLGHYRGSEPVRVEDVRALVPEAIPTSTWATLDAVAERRVRGSATRPGALVLLDRLVEETPPPLLIAQLHRRLRELVEVKAALNAGATAAGLVRQLKLKPYRAQRLAEQAARWSLGELEAALEALLALDLRFKNVPPATERQQRLAVTLWLLDAVAPRGGSATGRGISARSRGSAAGEFGA